jgi:iron complex outermembrane receptor protein
MKKYLLLAVTLSSLYKINGQQMIKGVVKDTETKKAMEGAIVTISSSSKYSMTRANGNFSIQSLSGDDTLFINKDGYYQEAVIVRNAKKFDVGLTKKGNKESDKGVNIGYGDADRRSLTSSVVEVGEKDFNKGAVSNIYEYLRGKVAGLSVDVNVNSPNGKPRVMLRGISSINVAYAEPLIVIDGVPGASLDTVDPLEVQKVSVLKDASAQAIYGSRATGGVLLITTKKSKNSKTN